MQTRTQARTQARTQPRTRTQARTQPPAQVRARSAIRRWRGWTGAVPFWLNSAALLLAPFTTVTLLAQVAVIATLAALGGLVRQLWHGDHGHPVVHLAAALMGVAAVAFVVS
ncbi:hypothetical protein ACFVGY_21755 [Streptomyces sp. NPDC127106]|uniref:hypothetical protein n=1 Tax=Streptomyces sp. NPDC127106 TaxID=3345360 RepID=UPI00363E3F54